MNLLKFLILLIITVTSVNGEESCHIYLKNGNSLPFNIVRIQPWGVTNESRLSASFKVIDSLFTSDSLTALKIKSLSNDILIEQSKNGYLINLINYNAQNDFIKTTPLLIPNSISLFYQNTNVKRIGLNYDGNLFSSENLIHRIQISLGFNPNPEMLSYFNFALGFGYEMKFKDFESSMVLSYGLFGGSKHENEYSETNSVIFVSPIISCKIIEEFKVYLSSGFDILIYKEHPKIPEKELIFFLGIGIKLR